ncbi:MAG: hypothetical protein U9R50_00835 [Campylobacterota bacterium]|nr:hypothetical protein [Campylobacterota bacterium]
MFKVKSSIILLLHVSIISFFLGCDLNSNKNQNYVSAPADDRALIYSKSDQDTIKTVEKNSTQKPLFVNETMINKNKLQKRDPENQTPLGIWWIFAIGISIIVILYYIKLLIRKQKIILEKLEEHSH